MDEIGFLFDLAARDLPVWWPWLALAAIAVIALAVLRKLRAAGERRRRSGERLILDGSNILYRKGDAPKIAPVIEAVRTITALGYAPGVVFDANAGHLLAGRYLHHDGFGRMLGIPAENVMVVPKGEPADGFILTAARELGARIVTNDRYRDWARGYPEVASPGHLIKGGYDDAGLWFDLEMKPDRTSQT